MASTQRVRLARRAGIAAVVVCVGIFITYGAFAPSHDAGPPLPRPTRRPGKRIYIRPVKMAPATVAPQEEHSNTTQPPPTEVLKKPFACATEDIQFQPPSESTVVSAVVVTIPFTEITSTRHAWYDAGRTTQPVTVSFQDAVPVAVVDRLAMATRNGLICTIVVAFPDAQLKADSPPLVRDTDVEQTLRRVWPALSSPPLTRTECRRCGHQVRRIVAVRVRVNDVTEADQVYAGHRALTELFDGTLVDGTVPRPAAAAVISGDVYPEDSGHEFARKLTEELRHRNGNALVGSVLLNNDAVRNGGFSAVARQSTGGAGLVDHFQGWHQDDPRVAGPREVQFLPHGAFAVTAGTWARLRAAERGGSGNAARHPIMDRLPPSSPDPAALSRELALGVSAVRGAIASLVEYVSAVDSLNAALPDSAAKATVARVKGSCRRTELAANASAELLKLSREAMHWRKRVEPFREPLQETMLSLHCSNRVVDAITGQFDHDIPGLVVGDDGNLDLASGEGTGLAPLVDVLTRSADKATVVRQFLPAAALQPIRAASSALSGLAAVRGEASALGLTLAHCRLCIDALSSQCESIPEGNRADAVRCGVTVNDAAKAIGAAHNATLEVAAFLERHVLTLLDRHHTLDRLCTSAWSVSQWAQLNVAASRAKVPRVAVRSPATVAFSSPSFPDVAVNEGHRMQYVTQLQYDHMSWYGLAVGVSADDPVLLEVEKEASKAYLTHTARVQWGLPCDCAGFTVEGVWIITGLRKHLEARHGNSPLCYCPGPFGSSFETIWNAFNFGRTPLYRWRTMIGLRQETGVEDVVDVHVHHWDPLSAHHISFGQEPTSGDYHIMRTMYEFSRIPPEWVAPLNGNRFEEIWVPCLSVQQAFIDSGVNASKLHIVPEPIDTETFDRDRVDAATFPLMDGQARALIEPRPDQEIRESFKFCSMFKFEPRKGYHALLEAFYKSFTRTDKVSLMIVGYLWGELPKGAKGADDVDAMRGVLEKEAARHGKVIHGDLPHIEVTTKRLVDNDIARFYKACDAFVLPSHGEGWGLPVMQAMAMGLPTITTNWSGIAAFTSADTVIFVNHTEREVPTEPRKIYNLPDGATWAEPDPEHLGTLMRHVRAMPPEERKALGERAMKHVRAEFNQDKVGLHIAERVVSIERTVRRRWAEEGRPAAKPALGEGVERLDVRRPKEAQGVA